MNLKQYVITAEDTEHEIKMTVDMDLLTPEMATEINTFWGDADWRLSQADGDVVQAVIRLFGQHAINKMLCEGGNDFSDEDVGLQVAEDLLDEEGWPGKDWKGFLIRSACVALPSFDQIEVRAE